MLLEDSAPEKRIEIARSNPDESQPFVARGPREQNWPTLSLANREHLYAEGGR